MQIVTRRYNNNEKEKKKKYLTVTTHSTKNVLFSAFVSPKKCSQQNIYSRIYFSFPFFNLSRKKLHLDESQVQN